MTIMHPAIARRRLNAAMTLAVGFPSMESCALAAQCLADEIDAIIFEQACRELGRRSYLLTQ